MSPSIVRFTMCVKNRHSRAEETKPGLFTTRANWSRTAVAGTGSAAELARDFPDDNGGVGTFFSPPFIMLHETSQCYGELTAAYGQSKAGRLSVESGSFRESMQTYRQAGTVIFVSNRSPEATVAQGIEARGLVVQWARNIRAAVDLLNSAREKTVIVTELALADGNWRDLVERMRGIDLSVPIVLATSSSTAELWWDALECGIDDILPGDLVASRLCQLLETQRAS
jgi:CheY-like chemotaxis protein